MHRYAVFPDAREDAELVAQGKSLEQEVYNALPGLFRAVAPVLEPPRIACSVPSATPTSMVLAGRDIGEPQASAMGRFGDMNAYRMSSEPGVGARIRITPSRLFDTMV